MSKLIFGSNISGLVWGFYNKDYEVIAPIQGALPKGNQFTQSNMVWLHDSYESRKLLKDLGYTDVAKLSRQSRVGYWNGSISDKLTPELSQVLIQKKMTSWDKPLKPVELDSSKLSMTSSEDDVPYMNVLGVDLNNLVKELKKRVKVTHGYMLEVYNGQVGISNKPSESGIAYIKYDHLVSTIPAPTFWGACRHCYPLITDEMNEGHFKSLPITNITTKQRPVGYDDRYEMVYYGVETFPWTRASFIDGIYGLEITGEMPLEKFNKLWPSIPVENHFINPIGRLIPTINRPPNDKVTFSGRFAEWDYNLTTEFVIKQALDNLESK